MRGIAIDVAVVCFILLIFQTGFELLEYKSGPSTADKIILQADKYGASLVVCVSNDFEMNRGLAKYFKKTLQHTEPFKRKGIVGHVIAYSTQYHFI